MGDSLEQLYELPTIGEYGSKVEWDIDDNHSSNLVEGRLYNVSGNDINVTLYARFTYGDVESELQEYKVTIFPADNNSSSDEFVDAYYSSITETSGNALKQQLRLLITTTHTTQTTYDDCKEYLQNSDVDPNDSSKIILFYSGESVDGEWDGGDTWNREHIWPQSKGWFDGVNGSTRGAGADLHHIRPADPGVNSSRGNQLFGENSEYYDPNSLGCEYRGDVARIIFYLMVRYSESDSYEWSSICESYEILKKWNDEDPVDSSEITRNNYIYGIQGNRNPFIDNPKYADMIWG